MAASTEYEAKVTCQTSNEDSIEWVSLAITHVEYPAGDWFGKILAMFSMLPLAIASGLVTLILFRRDLHTITFSIGIIVSEILNLVLKYMIRDPRPTRKHAMYTEYGMPSSHSQFMWFFATYFTLFILIRLPHVNNSSLQENMWKVAVSVGCILSAAIVSLSRIYLQYHTWMQVLCGAVAGILLASVWLTVTQVVLTPFFPVIASWPISELLLIRDTTLIPNVLWFEYTNSRQEARARGRGRKLVSMKSQ